MFVWCVILFGLGVAAFLDSVFNYGEIFRRGNSVLFMLVSLGLLWRLWLDSRNKSSLKLQKTQEADFKSKEAKEPAATV